MSDCRTNCPGEAEEDVQSGAVQQQDPTACARGVKAVPQPACRQAFLEDLPTPWILFPQRDWADVLEQNCSLNFSVSARGDEELGARGGRGRRWRMWEWRAAQKEGAEEKGKEEIKQKSR